jgi:hypothetical protein
MRLRDTLKFSLELLLPEKVFRAANRLVPDPRRELLQDVPASVEAEEANQVGTARSIIEELDHNQFGGPSFGPQTIALMSKALDDAHASLPGPVSDERLRLIAAAILKVAGDGERDPVRLRTAAMSALESDATKADGEPPARASTEPPASLG